jgi:hypothetical protein
MGYVTRRVIRNSRRNRRTRYARQYRSNRKSVKVFVAIMYMPFALLGLCFVAALIGMIVVAIAGVA